MITKKRVKLLASRVRHLKTALFFDRSSSILRFPPSIITVFDVDTSGSISFFVSRPFSDMSGVHKEFISELQCYTKGCDFYITIHGKAKIVPDEERLPLEPNPATGDTKVLLKVYILRAECYYYSKRKWASMQQIKSSVW